jgi:arylsulfatase A-like enzyme
MPVDAETFALLEATVARFVAERLLPAATLRAAQRANQDAWAYMAGEVVMSTRDFMGLRGLYDAEIAYVDACVAALLDFLAGVGGLDNTVIIITADHGENIGDHGLMDHQYCVYDTLAHVPLMVHYPGVFPVGDDETPVQHTDLFPTLLDLATAEMPDPPPRPALPGRSLLSPPPERPVQVIQYTAPQRERFARRHPHFDMTAHGFDRTFDAIVVRGYKLIRSNRGDIELYDLEDDPAETTDLAGSQPARVASLTAELEAWLAAHPPLGQTTAAAVLDKDLANHLRGLGYL